ncbi:uncharacterized protein LOC143291641 isoform X2 [Babylonia areolata]|uniref:uncharacterized protein LOC143291641 isoform X2 n=1 Tax=Babylonia areolata TaxID=304850 RepID=UPI003FCFE7D4
MTLTKVSRRLLLIPSIMVIFAECVHCSDPQLVTCNMLSVVKGHKGELTCDFGVNMQDEGQRQEIYIERQTSNRSAEYIAYCIRNGYPDYKCKPLSGLTRLDFSNITRYLTVGLSSVSQEDEGDYICQVADPDWPAPKTCDFALKNPQVVTCNMPSVVKGQKAELTCDFGVNMQDEGQRQEIYIERRTSSGETEYIAYCIRNGYPDYKCKPLSGLTRLDFSNITRYLTVGLSSASQEDEGDYICQVADPDWPVLKTCNFALKRPPSPAKCPGRQSSVGSTPPAQVDGPKAEALSSEAAAQEQDDPGCGGPSGPEQEDWSKDAGETVMHVALGMMAAVSVIMAITMVVFHLYRNSRRLQRVGKRMKRPEKKQVGIDESHGTGVTTESLSGKSGVDTDEDEDKDESLQPLASGTEQLTHAEGSLGQSRVDTDEDKGKDESLQPLASGTEQLTHAEGSLGQSRVDTDEDKDKDESVQPLASGTEQPMYTAISIEPQDKGDSREDKDVDLHLTTVQDC